MRAQITKLIAWIGLSTSGYRKCGDYSMWWALQRIAMAYVKPGQHDMFLSVLGNQSSQFDHFDRPVLAYKRWCRAVFLNRFWSVALLAPAEPLDLPWPPWPLIKKEAPPTGSWAEPQAANDFWTFCTRAAFWMLTVSKNNTEIQANITAVGVGKITLHTCISNLWIECNWASVASEIFLEKMGGRLRNANMCLSNFIYS